jgi:hypothetical protein
MFLDYRVISKASYEMHLRRFRMAEGPAVARPAVSIVCACR